LMLEHAHRLMHAGFKAALSEIYRTPDIAAGFHPPLVTTTFWRAQYWVLARFLNIDDVYDLIAWLGFALDGLFSYLLARELRCTALTAALVGLSVVSLEVFDARVLGHLHLAFFFYQLIACWMSIRAARQPTLPRMIAAGAGLWFGFLGNEYYGYFSLFFCAVLFCGYRFLGPRVPIRRVLPGLFAAAITFCTLMVT